MEGASAAPLGTGGGLLRAGEASRVWRARRRCRSHEEPGWGCLACEQHAEGLDRVYDGAFRAGKEGASEAMKRTIFCGAQEGPLAGDFLLRAPGLGCLPGERCCSS